MADNTQASLDPIVATDDIDGAAYQRIKVVLGPDGVNGGDVGLDNPMPVTDATAAELLDGLQTLLLRLLNATNSPRGYDVGLGRNRVSALVESGTITTVSTVTNVGTVGNQNTMGGTQAQLLANGQNVSAWAATVRSRIT